MKKKEKEIINPIQIEKKNITPQTERTGRQTMPSKQSFYEKPSQSTERDSVKTQNSARTYKQGDKYLSNKV